MPATIVETNTKKFKRKDMDPITLDIIENAMMNLSLIHISEPTRPY